MWVPLMADAWPLKRPMRARVPAAALRVVCVRPLYARIVSWVDGKLACACPRVPAPRVPPPMANGSACPDLSGRGEAGKRTEGTPPAASAANRQPILDTAGCHVIYLRQRAGRGTGPTSDIQVHLNLHIPPGQHRCVLHGKCQHIGRDAAAGTQPCLTLLQGPRTTSIAHYSTSTGNWCARSPKNRAASAAGRSWHASVCTNPRMWAYVQLQNPAQYYPNQNRRQDGPAGNRMQWLAWSSTGSTLAGGLRACSRSNPQASCATT